MLGKYFMEVTDLEPKEGLLSGRFRAELIKVILDWRLVTYLDPGPQDSGLVVVPTLFGGLIQGRLELR